MAEALRRRMWAGRLTRWALWFSAGAVVAALVGALGSGQELWSFRTGFLVLRIAFFAAIAGILFALIAIVMGWRGQRGLLPRTLIALAIGLLFIAYIGNQVSTARSVPAIHDVATDLDDYPRFYRLRVRDDNLASIPDLGRSDLARLPPRERWRAIHRAAYGDLRTVAVPWDVAETVRRAEALARERGWEVVTSDPRMGIVEAVDTSTFFRFKDNVLVRVRPARDGGGSQVDMRSISRVGTSDLGVNAERVRGFLKDLQAQA